MWWDTCCADTLQTSHSPDSSAIACGPSAVTHASSPASPTDKKGFGADSLKQPRAPGILTRRRDARSPEDMDAAGCMLDSECWMLDATCYMLDSACWMLNAACWMLDSACWMLHAGCWILNAGCTCWILDSGFCMLDSGFWMLHAGC